MKKLLAILLAALLVFALIGCAAQEENEENGGEENTEVVSENVYEDFKYDVNENGELEITGYTYTGEKLANVSVPSEIEGRQIVGIGKDAFKAHKNIATVTLPNTIEYVDSFAFADCEYLSSITFSKNLQNIGDGAFRNCSSLEKVELPAALLEIGVGAFQNCSALKNFTIPENILTIDKSAFGGCTSLTKVTIPSSIIDLGDGAFYGCTALVEVNLLGDIDTKDSEILAKMNAVILAAPEAPETLTEANALLKANGLHLGTLSDKGAKFVWDASENQIYGAFTKADATLLTSINNILEKNECSSIDFVTSVLKAEGISLASLNTDIKSDKFVWDADLQLFTTAFMGNAFTGCSENTIVSITEGTFFAEKAIAYGYITVIPANIPTEITNAKIFSNGEITFYYPEALTMTVDNDLDVITFSGETFLLKLSSTARGTATPTATSYVHTVRNTDYIFETTGTIPQMILDSLAEVN